MILSISIVNLIKIFIKEFKVNRRKVKRLIWKLETIVSNRAKMFKQEITLKKVQPIVKQALILEKKIHKKILDFRHQIIS